MGFITAHNGKCGIIWLPEWGFVYYSMKSYKMNDGNRFYDYPAQREELIKKEKHKQTCLKNRRKRKKKKRK